MKISTAALQRLSMSALCTVLAFAPTGNLDGASYSVNFPKSYTKVAFRS